MSLISAVDRLYQSRWLPSDDHPDLPRLPDGRRYPALPHIKREFNDLGLSLRLTESNDTVLAQWAPVGEAIILTNQHDAEHGQVTAKSQPEAAVLALTKLRELQAQPTEPELTPSF
jgi:hypothetical protein